MKRARGSIGQVEVSVQGTEQRGSLPVTGEFQHKVCSFRESPVGQKWLGVCTTSCLAVDCGHSKKNFGTALASPALLSHWLGPAPKRARPRTAPNVR